MFGRHVHALAVVAPLMLGAVGSLGCGHSDDEWNAQIAKYTEIISGKDKELDAAKARVAALEAELKKMGVETAGLHDSLDEQAKALEAYKARAHQLELIKARFELLRGKLQALTNLGLKVSIRHNRMVISLPGDVLFDTGKDSLRKDGKDIVDKVASVIRGDATLANRDYQVAGHTDDQPLKGGVFHDNWGLSVMRARQVVVYLVDDKGGGLSRQHWSAAGFADTDPVAPNSSPDGQQKNRRCDIIVVPSAEEMLDLTALAR